MMETHNSVKIIALNVNSLISTQKKHSLKVFLDEQKPEVIMLSETNLSPNHNITYKNYNIIRNDKTNEKRGTAILLNRKLEYKISNCINNKNFKCIESTTVILNLRENNNLILVSLYASHYHNSAFINELSKIFELLKLEYPNNYYIISGDFNAKHYKHIGL